MTPRANDLVLMVVNDGNGSICGMSYADRCKAAEFGIADYRIACRQADSYSARHFETPAATRQDIIEAATEVQAYYRNHVKECQQ